MLQRLIAVVATVLTAAALLAVGTVWIVRLPVVEDALRDRVVRAIGAAADGLGARIGRVHATGVRTVVADDVELRVDGRRFARVPQVTMTLSLRALLGGRLAFARVVVEHPDVRLERTAAGWRLPRAHPTADAATPPVHVDRLEVVDGRVVIDRRRSVTAIQAIAGIDLTPAGLRLALDRASGLPRGIDLGPTTAGGALRVGSTGAIVLEGVSVATPRSRVTADGALAAGGAANTLVVRAAPLAAADARAVHPSVALEPDVVATLRVGGTGDAPRPRLVADLRAGGRVRAAARVRRIASGVGLWRLRAAFHGLDPAAIVAGLPVARAAGRLSASGRGLDPARDRVAWALDLAPSTLAGHAVEGATARGRGTVDVHHLRVRADTAAGSVRARGAITDRRRPRYRVAAEVRVERLAVLLPGLEGRGEAHVDLRGAGVTEADRGAAAQVRVRALDVRGVVLSGGTAAVRLAGTQLEVSNLLLDGPALRAAGTGSMDLARRMVDATVTARGDLHAFVPAIAGLTEASASARGPLDDLQVSARSRIEDATWGETTARRVDAVLDARGVGGARASATVQLDLAGGRHARTAFDARAAGSVRRDGPRLAGTVDTLSFRPSASGVWSLARPARFVVEEALAIDGFTLSSGAQRITLDGRVARRGRAQARLTLAGVELADLCAATAGPACGGVLAGTLRLDGSAEAPDLAADVRVRGLTANAVRYGDLQVGATYARCLASLRGTIDHEAARDVRIEGTWPIDLAWAGPGCDLRGRSVAVDVHAARVDLAGLRAAAPGTIRSIAGTVSADLRLRGTPGAVAAGGTATLDGGRLELFGTGVPWRDIRMQLVAAGDHVAVRGLSARGGDGTLEGTGRIDLTGLEPGALAVDVQLANFLAVRQGGYEGTLAGPLAVRGTAAAPEVTGSLTVPRLVIRPAALPGGAPALAPDPTIEVIGIAAPPPAPVAATSTVADALSLRVDLTLGTDAWIRRADANVQLGGSVRLEKMPHAPFAVTGTLRLLRGTYAFQGRRFTVDRGEIVFPPGRDATPALDVTATYRVGGYFVTVQVNGPVERPTLTLSSDPPLDQADILSVLLFGRPTSTLGPTETTALQRETVTLAAGYAAPELNSSVRDALGLDLLDVSMPQGESTPGEVKIGRYVTDDVFVTLAQEFGPRMAQIVGLEYHLRRSVSVRLSTSTRGASAIDVFWHRRY